MRGIFLFLAARGGGTLPPHLPRLYRAVARRNEYPDLAWIEGPGWAAALGPDGPGAGTGPGVAQTPEWLVVGNARLDGPLPPRRRRAHPEEIHPLPSGRLIPGLGVIAGVLEEKGASGVDDLIGDFGVAAWHPRHRVLLLARDALGGRALFYRVGPGHVAVSSRAAFLAHDERYDPDFIASYLSGGWDPDERTIFAGVNTLPGGCRGRIHTATGATEIHRYWRPEEIEVDHALGLVEAGERFRTLFQQAVATRVGPAPGETWAHLSGGLDSSSIVSVASALAEAGETPPLAGTITMTEGEDRPELPWVQSVLDRYGLHNEVYLDPGPFAGSAKSLPLTDGPSFQYPYHARDRWMLDTLQASGGQILLSGFGADHYLTGNLNHLADWFATGRLLDTWREALRWAVHRRTSVWSILREGLVEPSIGRGFLQGTPDTSRRSWLHPARRPPSLPSHQAVLKGRRGRKHTDAILVLLLDLPLSADRNHLSQWIEVRYPFMHRPLVELALTLPPLTRALPGAPKRVLRAAIHELPQLVRTRSGKGTVTSQAMRSWKQLAPVTDRLLDQPLLAELGAIDAQALRSAVRRAQVAPDLTSISLLPPLSLELWLQVRTGRWSRQPNQAGSQRTINSDRAQTASSS